LLVSHVRVIFPAHLLSLCQHPHIIRRLQDAKLHHGRVSRLAQRCIVESHSEGARFELGFDTGCLG
jgi:hypothetical protein